MERGQLGQRLKQLREMSGLRQAQVAAYLAVDQSYLSKMEAGERSVPTELLEKLAEFYGCGLETFEAEDVEVQPIQFAFRTSDMTGDDLHVVSVVNHIAANSRMMAKLLEGENDK